MLRPYLWWDLIYSLTPSGRENKHCLEILHGLTRRVIAQRDADFDSSETPKRPAFLDILLKAKRDDPTITFDDIQEEVDMFMFEGHDTTAVAAGWACHMIGSHPDVQRKLHDEIDRVLGFSLSRISDRFLYVTITIFAFNLTLKEERTGL